MATYGLTNKLLDTKTLDDLRRQMSIAWLRPINCRPEWRDAYMLRGMNQTNVFTATRAKVREDYTDGASGNLIRL